MSWQDQNGTTIPGRGLRADVGTPGRLPREATLETIGSSELDELEADFGQPWPDGMMAKFVKRKKRGTK